MKTWNIGNTTVRNPYRLREALQLFRIKMHGRAFGKAEQQEYLNELVMAGLVDSSRVVEGDDGGRKFASAFKQLGFVTDWSRGKSWEMTSVGTMLIEHPELEEVIFLRQMLKYQIPSPLEAGSRLEGFHLRPFRLLLRFLKRIHEENLVGLTKFEIALYVIHVLDENNETEFERAVSNIKVFRAGYNSLVGKVRKNEYIQSKLMEVAALAHLEPGSLLDYADSNGRYALITGLLTTQGNKLALSDARMSIIEAILSDDTTLSPVSEYLPFFYNPDMPQLPTDDARFLQGEIVNLEKQIVELAALADESTTLPTPPKGVTVSDLQAYEIRLREKLQGVREIQFYRNQCSTSAIDEIVDLLEDLNTGTRVFFGGSDYAPAFLEWAIWRLFLAINEIVGSISKTRGFRIDEDINPIHHAKGGDADLTFNYDNFKLVCEMTLMGGSRQFASEGEPVTRHVFRAKEVSDGKPVYGLFIARKLDPNTVDAFHHARYWKTFERPVSTPIVALEIGQVLLLLDRMKSQKVSAADIRTLLDRILQMQEAYQDGPSWYKAYSALYEQWLRSG
jgi:hypothetical protein